MAGRSGGGRRWAARLAARLLLARVQVIPLSSSSGKKTTPRFLRLVDRSRPRRRRAPQRQPLPPQPSRGPGEARPSHRAALVKLAARTLGLGWNPTRSPCRSAGVPGAAGEKRSRHVEQQQLLQVLLHPHSLLPPGVPTPSLPFLLCKTEHPTLT